MDWRSIYALSTAGHTHTAGLTCAPSSSSWVEEVWVESVRLFHGLQLGTNVLHLAEGGGEGREGGREGGGEGGRGGGREGGGRDEAGREEREELYYITAADRGTKTMCEMFVPSTL